MVCSRHGEIGLLAYVSVMKINSSLMIEYDQNNFFMYVETVNTGSFIVLLQGWAYACGSYIGCWHFMKIEIRPEVSILMFNCAAVKKWKRSVAWFPNYGAKCIADAERKFPRKHNVFTLLR